MEELVKNVNRNPDGNGAQNPIKAGALRIDSVHSLALQSGDDAAPDGRNRGVKAIPQIREMYLLPAESKEILEQRTLERGELVPFSRLFQTLEQIIFLFEHQQVRLLYLCYFEVPTHGEIDQDSRDVARVHRVIDEGADFSG